MVLCVIGCAFVFVFKLLMSYIRRPKEATNEPDVPELALVGKDEEYFSGIMGIWGRLMTKRRLNVYERREALAFIKQMVRRVDSIILEGEQRRQLLDHLFESTSPFKVRDNLNVLIARYGEELGSWMDEIFEAFPDCRPTLKQLKEMICTKKKVSTAGTALMIALQQLELDKEQLDHRVMRRIQSFASSVCSMIRFSFVIEPGRPRTDLREFLVEYEILENFNENIELNQEEMAQSAFDSNCLAKARNKKISCGDRNRVILREMPRLKFTEQSNNESVLRGIDMFGEINCPDVSVAEDYGTNDFIHANHVFGGPLRNKFILTQAPQSQTIVDFWHMIWQEKSRFIVMLCSVVDSENLALLGSAKPSGCPQYWPTPGESAEFGPFIVRNEGMSMTMDPLFQVTSLSLALIDDPTQTHSLQHWQYDWNKFDDFYWPLRILKRLRTSKTPSVIHCLDGCSRSGTLLLIETMLMQLLQGSENFSSPMLTSAVFLRLQRRHVVANHLQYLYAYRVVLHWCQPYIHSSYHRLLLGFYFDNSGFCGKFNDIVSSHGKGKLLTFK
jgi:protein tyrosine phosphatase